MRLDKPAGCHVSGFVEGASRQQSLRSWGLGTTQLGHHCEPPSCVPSKTWQLPRPSWKSCRIYVLYMNIICTHNLYFTVYVTKTLKPKKYRHWKKEKEKRKRTSEIKLKSRLLKRCEFQGGRYGPPGSSSSWSEGACDGVGLNTKVSSSDTWRDSKPSDALDAVSK